MNTQLSGRTAYFDYLRSFASLCIMIVHVAAYKWYYTDVHTISWSVLNIYKGINRPPVLLFIMISGALFLGRDIPVKTLYKKYVLRMCTAFIVWDVIYALVTSWNLGISGILFKLVNSNYHLWFLLALIGLYICIPLLRLIARDVRILKYFLNLSFLFAFLIPQMLQIASAFGGDTVSKYAGIIGGHIYNIRLDVILGYPFYFLAGYYLHNFEALEDVLVSEPSKVKISRRLLYVLGICGIISGILINNLYALKTGMPQDLFHNCFTLHEMFEALAIFVFFKHNIKKDPRTGNIVYKISACGFGAYLIHDLVILGIDHFLGLNAMTFDPVIAVPVIGIMTFILNLFFY